MSQPLDKKAGERQREEVLRLKAKSYEEIAREALEGVERDVRIGFALPTEVREKVALARAVLEQRQEIERLQSELRIEKASQATRGNA